MPMLRCAFWLSIVYASILLHPAASTDRDVTDALTDAAQAPAAAAGATTVAGRVAARLAAACATRADTCGDAALDAARGDAARLASLFASGAPDAPPLSAPRRHARVRVLTDMPRPCKGGCEPVTDAR